MARPLHPQGVLVWPLAGPFGARIWHRRVRMGRGRLGAAVAPARRVPRPPRCATSWRRAARPDVPYQCVYDALQDFHDLGPAVVRACVSYVRPFMFTSFFLPLFVFTFASL